MPKSSIRGSPFSLDCRRHSARRSGPHKKSNVTSFAMRKVSFDVNDEFDVTTRFLTSSHASLNNSVNFEPSRPTTATSTNSSSNSEAAPKRSLSRLSRSGCLRLLGNEHCSGNRRKRTAVPSVSEDDMSLASFSDDQVGLEIESSSSSTSPSPSPSSLLSLENDTEMDTSSAASSYISSCWGHFVDFYLQEQEDPEQEEQPRGGPNPKTNNSSKSGSSRRSKDSRFHPYPKEKTRTYAYPKSLPSRSCTNTTRTSSSTATTQPLPTPTTDDISTAMKRISLRQLSK